MILARIRASDRPREVATILLLVFMALTTVVIAGACAKRSPTASNCGSCGSGDVYWDRLCRALPRPRYRALRQELLLRALSIRGSNGYRT